MIKDKLQEAKVEADVAKIYNDFFTETLGVNTTSINNCDSLFFLGNEIPVIVEYKYNKDLCNRKAFAQILIQVLFYLKTFKDNCPITCIIADLNEIAVFSSSVLSKYLSEDVDWNVSPSIAPKCNQQLLDKMLVDPELMSIIVYSLDNVSEDNLINIINTTAKESYIVYIESCLARFKTSRAKFDRSLITLHKALNKYVEN